MGVGGGKSEEGGAARVEIVEERSEQDVGSKQRKYTLTKMSFHGHFDILLNRKEHM